MEPYEQRILNMEKNTTFTQGKILQPLILFALPVLFALFLQAMYGAVDLLIVGKFAASADVSAVSTGSQIMMTLTNLVSSFAMVAELIDHIEVYHAEKQDGVTNQRVTIHYNCIGAFEVPDRRKIPERDILLETRKGVALSYAPTQIAI